MDFAELYADTQRISFAANGFTGSRTWRVADADVDDFITWVSRLSFPGYSNMRCVGIDKEGLVGGVAKNGYTSYSQWIITAHYSSAPWLNEPPQENIEFSMETFETGEGRIWKNAGTTMDSSETIQNPTLTRAISFVSSSIPLTTILNSIGKVNKTAFQGFPAESLLFLGANSDQAYRWESGDYVYRISYRISWKRYGWNVVWRQPRQRIDEAGNLASDSEGNPVFVEGIAGTGAFDRPVPNLYDTCYFEPLFGMPIPGSNGGRGDYRANTKSLTITDVNPKPNIPWMKTK